MFLLVLASEGRSKGIGQKSPPRAAPCRRISISERQGARQQRHRASWQHTASLAESVTTRIGRPRGPPIEMRAGAQIDYSLSLLGVPLRWRTKITDYEPPVGFVDEQERGPYVLWA